MTDQQMDARLRAAGERFRAANPGPAPAVDSVDVAEVTPTSGGHRHQWLLTAAAAAVVALVVGLTLALRGSAPTRPPSADNAGLVGKVWLLTSGAKPSTAALYISRSGVLVADDECQLISSEVHISGPRITFTDSAVRLKPCLDPGFAPAFNGIGARVLRGKATFRIDSRGMSITHPGVGSLRFVLAQTPIPPPSPDIPTLTGTDWVAPNGKVLHIDPTTGQLSGDWCAGRATVTGSSVNFIGCAHAGSGTYLSSISGTALTLTRANLDLGGPPAQAMRIRFVWRPMDRSIIAPQSLTGGTWRLQTVSGAPARSGSLRIDGTTAVVDDGCTTYRRPVSVGSGTFTIAGGVPAHACTDQATTADSFVFNDPATWAIRAGKLIVYGGGSQEFALVYGSARRQSQNPSQLTGGAWRLTDTRVGPVDHKAIGQVTLKFPDSSTLSVVRCYTSQAAVEVTSDAVVVRDLHTTVALPCPSGPVGTQQQNDLIDSVLAGRLAWSIHRDQLVLSKGRAALTFRRPRPVPQSTLTRSHWTAVSLVRGDGPTASVSSTAPERFRFDGGEFRSDFMGSPVTVSPTVITFRAWTDLDVASSRRLGQRDTTFVQAKLLIGSVRWAVTGDRLILRKPGVGALTLTRS